MPATRLKLLAVASFAILGVGAFFVFSKPIDLITPQNFERLAPGMAESDVVAILGSSSSSDVVAILSSASSSEVNTILGPATHSKYWEGRTYAISIRFDRGGAMIDKEIWTRPSFRVFDRIKHGMTQGEVVALLGRIDRARENGNGISLEWYGSERCIAVHFDEAGCVCGANWGSLPAPTREPFFEKFRRWCGF